MRGTTAVDKTEKVGITLPIFPGQTGRQSARRCSEKHIHQKGSRTIHSIKGGQIMTTVTDFVSLVGTVGGGFVAGALAGYAIKKVMKIAAVIIGLFIAALAYLQYQGIIHVDWMKFQTVSQNGLTAIANTLINILNNIGTNHATATFSDLIPLTSSVSAGFMLGVLRG